MPRRESHPPENVCSGSGVIRTSCPCGQPIVVRIGANRQVGYSAQGQGVSACPNCKRPLPKDLSADELTDLLGRR